MIKRNIEKSKGSCVFKSSIERSIEAKRTTKVPSIGHYDPSFNLV